MQQQDRTFNPVKYINQYYKTPQGHPQENLQDKFQLWMKEAFQIVDHCENGIQIGCGPVLNLAAFASRKVSNLTLTEYNAQCFDIIDKWMKKEELPEKIDWTKLFQLIAKLQGTNQNVEQRTRQCIVNCCKIDLTKGQIFEYPFFRKANIVTSSLCIQAVASSNEHFKWIVSNISKYIAPKGYIFLVGVLEQTFYKVGDQILPCFKVTQKLLEETMLEQGFQIIKLNSHRPENLPAETSDFKGLFSLLARLK